MTNEITKEDLFAWLDEYFGVKYYSISESAEILDVSRGTIYNMVKAGELIPSIIHGQTKFAFQELNKFRLTSRSPVTRHVGLRPPVNSRPLLNHAS